MTSRGARATLAACVVVALAGCTSGKHVRLEPGRTLPSLPPLSTRLTTTTTTTIALATYTVLPGDTFGAIAATLGVNPDDLAALNHIDDRNRLIAGQVLYVPNGSVPTTSMAP